MSKPRTSKSERRNRFRRKSDRLIIDRLKRYRKLYKVGQLITSDIKMKDVFENIMEQTNAIMGTERSTVFLYDKPSGQLRSLVATGHKFSEIRISSDHGIAGWVFLNRKPQIINSPYEDPRFFPEIDKSSGFKTRNILCIPLINRNGECIGSFQTLNNKSGEFTEEDRQMLESVSNYVSISLENARLYEELMIMNKARERVINHLSHELKTPLAIMSAVFERLGTHLPDTGGENLKKTIQRGKRNLSRLLDLQEKIDDILHGRSLPEKERVLDIIETASDLLEELGETANPEERGIIEKMTERIETIFSPEKIQMVQIRLDTLIHEICDKAQENSKWREIKILGKISPGISLVMDQSVLEKVIGGMIKNAIENTPDEGKIEVCCREEINGARVDIRDFGVGISRENQALIFFGFFHTQDTMLYSSKRPYDFNAGGNGTDLFRMQALGERLGFKISFQSTRCPLAPEDSDVCVGRISKCAGLKNPSDCENSGGSLFSIQFPSERT